MQGNSMVAVMLAEINAQYQAAYAAIHGLASGTARHDFITAKLERAQQVGEQLIEQIGPEAALPLIVNVMNGDTSAGDDDDKAMTGGST